MMGFKRDGLAAWGGPLVGDAYSRCGVQGRTTMGREELVWVELHSRLASARFVRWTGVAC